MRRSTQRAAAFSAAILGVALIGTGCGKSEEKGSEALSSVSSVASSASSAISSAVTEPTESAAPSTTQMAGKDGKDYAVGGPILAKYNTLDANQKQDLGEPKDNEQKNPDGGVYQQFEGGVIVHTTRSYVVWGKIRDKWNELGGSQGKLGYPTSDETDAADGGKQQTFEHGTASWKPGEESATVTER